MINEVLNLICGVSVLAFMILCLPEALLTPQNEGVNVDLGWGVNVATSPFFLFIKHSNQNKEQIIKIYSSF